jgi:hypothetical protein
VPVGRIYVARWADEIRIMELSLQALDDLPRLTAHPKTGS